MLGESIPIMPVETGIRERIGRGVMPTRSPRDAKPTLVVLVCLVERAAILCQFMRQVILPSVLGRATRNFTKNNLAVHLDEMGRTLSIVSVDRKTGFAPLSALTAESPAL